MTETLTPAVPGRTDALTTLGVDVRGSGSAHQALVDAGIAGMGVRKVELYTASGKPVPGQYGLESADGLPLPNITVGQDFQVVQYEDNAAVLDAVAAYTGATIARAGAIDVRPYGMGGARAFVALELPEKYRIGGNNDPHTAYIAAFMSHGGSSNYFVPTATRVWCANQQPQITRNGKYKIVIRHTVSAPERTALAHETLKTTVEGFSQARREVEEMLARRVTDTQFRQIIDQVYPKGGESKSAETRYDKRVDQIEWLWRESPTNESIRGTAWGAYQTLLEYGEHVSNIRGGDGVAIADVRARRTLTSATMTKVQLAAFTAVRELVGLMNN